MCITKTEVLKQNDISIKFFCINSVFHFFDNHLLYFNRACRRPILVDLQQAKECISFLC